MPEFPIFSSLFNLPNLLNGGEEIETPEIPALLDSSPLPTNSTELAPAIRGNVPAPLPDRRFHPAMLAALAGLGFLGGRAPHAGNAVIQGFLQGQQLLNQMRAEEERARQGRERLRLEEERIRSDAETRKSLNEIRRIQAESLAEDRASRAEERLERRTLAQRTALEKTLDMILTNTKVAQAIAENPDQFPVRTPDGRKVSFTQAWIEAGRPVDDAGRPLIPQPEPKLIGVPSGGVIFDPTTKKPIFRNPTRPPSETSNLRTITRFNPMTGEDDVYVVDIKTHTMRKVFTIGEEVIHNGRRAVIRGVTPDGQAQIEYVDER